MKAPVWEQALRYLPIACVDIIFQQRDGSILYGYRIIGPYKNVWALPGGRMLHGENLQQAAGRIAKEYGMRIRELYLVGVFPMSFDVRHDVTIALASPCPKGDPVADIKELSKVIWSEKPPIRTGANYRKMISKWNIALSSKTFLKLNRLR